jgi:hypothetical protein
MASWGFRFKRQGRRRWPSMSDELAYDEDLGEELQQLLVVWAMAVDATGRHEHVKRALSEPWYHGVTFNARANYLVGERGVVAAQPLLEVVAEPVPFRERSMRRFADKPDLLSR